MTLTAGEGATAPFPSLRLLRRARWQLVAHGWEGCGFARFVRAVLLG